MIVLAQLNSTHPRIAGMVDGGFGMKGVLRPIVMSVWVSIGLTRGIRFHGWDTGERTENRGRQFLC